MRSNLAEKGWCLDQARFRGYRGKAVPAFRLGRGGGLGLSQVKLLLRRKRERAPHRRGRGLPLAGAGPRRGRGVFYANQSSAFALMGAGPLCSTAASPPLLPSTEAVLGAL